jgi:hypothetical protein
MYVMVMRKFFDYGFDGGVSAKLVEMVEGMEVCCQV